MFKRLNLHRQAHFHTQLRCAFDPRLIFFTQGALCVFQLLSGFNFTRVLISSMSIQRVSPASHVCIILWNLLFNSNTRANPAESCWLPEYPQIQAMWGTIKGPTQTVIMHILKRSRSGLITQIYHAASSVWMNALCSTQVLSPHRWIYISPQLRWDHTHKSNFSA